MLNEAKTYMPLFYAERGKGTCFILNEPKHRLWFYVSFYDPDKLITYTILVT